MSKKYVGMLEKSDPLFFYLNYIEKFKLHKPVSDFYYVKNLSGSKENVYEYLSDKKRPVFAVKFANHTKAKIKAYKLLMREFNNIRQIRDYQTDKCRVVNAYAAVANVNYALIESYVRGKTLDHYIKQSIYKNKSYKLYGKLSLLANLLNVMHNVNVEKEIKSYNFSYEILYLDKLLNKLELSNIIDKNLRQKIRKKATNRLYSIDKCEITNIHGDVTPSNFIFNDGKIWAIDLEKMKTACNLLDLGFLVSELKHHFTLFTGNEYNAECYIGHFLWEYCKHKGVEYFKKCTLNLPFFIALGLLRIARNTYLDLNYRRMLVDESLRVLYD